jgi:hypothetical protein
MTTMELEDFITIMSRGHTTLTRTELSGAMALYREELLGLLSQGMAVKTPTGTFYFGAAGSLDAIDTPFLPGSAETNHRIRLRHKSDRAFENAAKLELSVERDERPDFAIPVLNTASLAGEGQEGLPLRVSDTAEIKGIRLALWQNNPECGLHRRRIDVCCLYMILIDRLETHDKFIPP